VPWKVEFSKYSINIHRIEKIYSALSDKKPQGENWKNGKINQCGGHCNGDWESTWTSVDLSNVINCPGGKKLILYNFWPNQTNPNLPENTRQLTDVCCHIGILT